MYEGNPGEINLMVQVSARSELANLRFGLLRVDCKMKKIRRFSFSGLHFRGLHFQVHVFGCLPPIFRGSLFSGLRSSFLGVFIFAMTINPHSFDTLKDLMWHSGFNWSVN